MGRIGAHHLAIIINIIARSKCAMATTLRQPTLKAKPIPTDQALHRERESEAKLALNKIAEITAIEIAGALTPRRLS